MVRVFGPVCRMEDEPRDGAVSGTIPMVERFHLPDSLQGFRVHLVGIKGTGMAALAEVLTARGARVSGSDTTEKFYTDSVLQRLSIPYVEGFREENLPVDAQLVVHSAAYRKDENPELLSAARRGIPLVIYPEALGMLSLRSDSSGISGVHGKSTTTAMCGAILKEWGFPATVLVGAEVPGLRRAKHPGAGGPLSRGGNLRIPPPLPQLPVLHASSSRASSRITWTISGTCEDMLSAFETYGVSLPPGHA